MNSPDVTARASGSADPAQVPDMRLQQLKAGLDDYARIARYLGADFQRAVRELSERLPGHGCRLRGQDHREAPQAAADPLRRTAHPGRKDAPGPDPPAPTLHPQPPGPGRAAPDPAAAQPRRFPAALNTRECYRFANALSRVFLAFQSRDTNRHVKIATRPPPAAIELI